MASGPITSWQIDGETVEKQCQTLYFGAPKSLQMVIAAMKLKDTYSLDYRKSKTVPETSALLTTPKPLTL